MELRSKGYVSLVLLEAIVESWYAQKLGAGQATLVDEASCLPGICFVLNVPFMPSDDTIDCASLFRIMHAWS